MALTFFPFGSLEGDGGALPLRHLSGEFSDKTLWVLGVDQNGPKSLRLYTSADAGVTFVDQGTVTLFGLGSVFAYQAGDTLHVSIAESPSPKYVRMVWNTQLKTFSVPVSLTTIATLTSIGVFSVHLGQEPGGRLWAAIRYRRDATNNDFDVYFSDDNGASWTFSIQIATAGSGTGAGSPTRGCAIAVLQFKTIVGWVDQDVTAGFKVRERSHTDPTGTWGGEATKNSAIESQQISGASAGPTGGFTKEFAWVYGDHTISPTKPSLHTTKVSEDGSGVLTYANHSFFYTKFAFGGGDAWPAISGYDDGYRIYVLDTTETPSNDIRQFTMGKAVASAPSGPVIEGLPFATVNEGNFEGAGTLTGRLVAAARLISVRDPSGAGGGGGTLIGSEGFSIQEPGGSGGGGIMGEPSRETVERGTQIKNPFGGRMRRNACMCKGSCNCS